MGSTGSKVFSPSSTESTSGTSSNRSGSMASSGDNHSSRRTCRQLRDRVWVSRACFVVGVVAVAASLSYAAFRLLTDSESRLAQEQFHSIADQALKKALEITLRKRLGAKSLATTMAYLFPNQTMWPFVNIVGFEAIAKSIINTADASSMGLAVRVPKARMQALEDYAYHVAFPANGYPQNTTGVSPYIGEFGVYGISPNFTRYLERNATDAPYWNSTYRDDVWPYLMHSDGTPILMLNLHSYPTSGVNIETVQKCAENSTYHDEVDQLANCAILSDIKVMYLANNQTALGAQIMQPIYPHHDPTALVGIVSSSLTWDRILDTLFPTEVSGIDAVLETVTQTYTFQVTQGNMTLLGEGDLHHPRFSDYAKTIEFHRPELFTFSSAHYKLTFYPNEVFVETYSTDNPTIALVGCLAIIIVFTSILFFGYDWFVRQDIQAKQKLLDAKRQYVRFISHEVRTPLNTIVMGSQVVQDDILTYQAATKAKQHVCEKQDDLGEKLTDWSSLADDILTNARSAVCVLNDLLNYDKIETNSLNLELTIIPIWALVKKTASEFHLSAMAKKIHYNVDFSPLAKTLVDRSASEVEVDETGANCSLQELPDAVKEQRVIGDVMRITEIMRNFLSNAMKFTSEGGTISVKASWLQGKFNSNESETFTLHSGDVISVAQTGSIRVDVSDSGAGMTEEQLSRVFDQGTQFRVNELQAGQGSGLGLFIAQGIAKQHGGKLTVASAGIGHGTTFSMTLPLRRVPDSIIPESLKSQVRLLDQAHDTGILKLDSPQSLQSFRILVVDDAPVNRKLLMRILGRKGHTCDEAENGKDGLEMVRESIKQCRPYDSVLLDYEMPVMNGPTAAAEMRKIGCSSFIVGITGNVFEEDMQFFRDHGANCVLPKPVDVRELEERWVEYGVACVSETSAEF